MRIGWSLFTILRALLTLVSAQAVILAAIGLQWSVIPRALVCVRFFLLTRWTWRKAGRKNELSRCYFFFWLPPLF
jgi:hypothetical protein